MIVKAYLALISIIKPLVNWAEHFMKKDRNAERERKKGGQSYRCWFITFPDSKDHLNRSWMKKYYWNI